MELLFLRQVRYLVFIIFLFAGNSGWSQPVNDSFTRRDSLPVTDSASADSIMRQHVAVRDTFRPVLKYSFTSDSFLYGERLFFRFTNPVRYTVSEKKWEGKEVIFYSIIALLLFFALIRNAFSRYLSDLFSAYFRTTIRQRQIKEQLLQSPLPSMLFNIFFIISTGIFLSLLFQHFGLAVELPFWLLAAYCALALTIIYAGKFVLLKFFGWVFQLSEATETYIFVVFSTNKIIGVAVLPFTALLAFTYGAYNAAAATLSLILIGALFIYRYFLAFTSINHQVKINFLHFVIYLAAFEVLPLLLINKLLFAILSEIS